MLKKNRHLIMAPVNGSPASEQAFRWACQLARNSRAELLALYVYEVPMEAPLGSALGRSSIMQGERILKSAEEIAESEHCRVGAMMVEARNAGPAIVLEAADKGVDLLVVGVPYEESGPLIQAGSTADYLLKNSHCQVVISRGATSGAANGQD